jgi:hypothetical protein
LQVEALVDGVKEVVIDSRDLTISKVYQDDKDVKVRDLCRA